MTESYEQSIAMKFTEGAFCLTQKNSTLCPVSEQLLLTQSGDTDIKQYILEQIEEATDYLKICSFLLTDTEIFKALINKSRRYDIAIFLLTSLDESKILSSSFDEELEQHDLDTHLKLISSLFQEGVHVRAASYIHAKFLIVDGETGLLTSANLTPNSLNTNPESGVILHGQDLNDLEKVFDSVYVHGTEFRQFLIRGEKMDISYTSADMPAQEIPEVTSNLRFTLTNHSQSIYDGLLEIIAEASEELNLSTYNFAELEKLPKLMDVLRAARGREVKVKLFCRGMNHRQDHLDASTMLADIGCEIRADVFNHAKGISNGQRTMIFTANIDGRHGLVDSGFEVGCMLTGAQSQAFHSFMHWQFDNAPLHFVSKPQRAHFFETYDWIQSQKGNVTDLGNFEELILRLKGFDKETYDKIISVPLYGIYEGEKLCAIAYENQRYLASQGDLENVIRVENEGEQSTSKNKHLLRYHSLNITLDKK